MLVHGSARRRGAPETQGFAANPATRWARRISKELRGLLTHIPLMPGSVTLANAESFIKAGARGLGLGSALAEPRLIAERRFDELPERAIAFLRIAAQAQRTT